MQNPLNLKITDKDLGLTPLQNVVYTSFRQGARGVVYDNTHIAIIYKKQKNEYKLPWGGVDEGETPLEAFERECWEELGARLKNIHPIGTIVEEKSQEKFIQTSHLFIAKLAENKEKNLTQQEQEEGLEVLRMKPEEALAKMKDCLTVLKASAYDSLYRSKFMVLRDIKILEQLIIPPSE